jgi:hypothetical protein
MRKLIAVCILMAAVFGTATATMPNALAADTHSVSLYGPVTCRKSSQFL